MRLIGPKTPIECEIGVGMYFHIPPSPKCAPIASNQAHWASAGHRIKPDLSNLVKFYEDAGNGILWHDDSQISSLTTKKILAINPITIITIEQIHMPHRATALMSHLNPEKLRQLAIYCDEFLRLYDQTKIHFGDNYPSVANNPNFVKMAEVLAEIGLEFSKPLAKIHKEIEKYV